MRQFRAILAYDGTEFLGFQIQANGRTVQGVIEAVLEQITKRPSRIIGAGRTDTGVHAAGQVISFKIQWRHSIGKLQKALNVKLPTDIVVLSLTEIAGDFHPRYDALARQYRYTILNQAVRNVFSRRYALWVPQDIDFEAMQAASRYLLGTHDFATFGRPPQGTNSIRTVSQADWCVKDTTMSFEITANAFLYRMVRNIVGTILDVGLGNLAIKQIPDILLAKDRSKSGAPVAPYGLSLIKVYY